MLLSLYRWGNWSWERPCSLSKHPQLTSVKQCINQNHILKQILPLSYLEQHWLRIKSKCILVPSELCLISSTQSSPSTSSSPTHLLPIPGTGHVSVPISAFTLPLPWLFPGWPCMCHLSEEPCLANTSKGTPPLLPSNLLECSVWLSRFEIKIVN